MNGESGREALSGMSDVSVVPDNLKKALLDKVQSLAVYKPVVAMLGATGAGKSRLGSALFGRDVFKVSDVRAGTREVQREKISIFGADIELLDFPGVGESRDRDAEYQALYRAYIDKVDVVLWLVKIDNRALATDEEFLRDVVAPSGFPLDKILFVISQSDKADPIRDWDQQRARPGERQQSTIDEKTNHLRELFGASPARVVPISADEGYNLHTLAERIIAVCPNEAALNVARTLGKEYRTEEVKKASLKRSCSRWASFTRHIMKKSTMR